MSIIKPTQELGETRTAMGWHVMNSLDEIESGELENKCTPQELEKVKHFVAFLAKEGVLPDNSEESLSLDDDIHKKPQESAG